MLERVALGQTRFSMPGLTVDGRGIALGRSGVVLFPSLDGVVGWLRLFGGETSIDDLGAELKILRVVSPLGGRAHLLVMPAGSSEVLDRTARCARLVGGSTFTGSSKHLVKYRDERAPYGYDVVTLEAAPAGTDFVLHADEGARPYRRDAEVTLRSLLLRLSLRRLPGAGREIDAGVGELLIGVQPGLGAGVIRYLWRNHVRAEAALVVPRAFGGAPAETRFLLVRAHEPAPRVVRNLRGVPGLTLYRPVAATVAVELGWEHPVELASCLSAFEAGALYLFCGSRGEVEVVVGPVEYAELGRLVEAGSPAAAAPVLHEGAARRPPESGIGVALTLAPTLAGPRRVIGALVPWEQAALLKKLLYLLPPAMLDGHQLATCDRGLILLASRTIDIVPLGTLLGERLPGLLIPVGMELVPRVTPEALAEALGHRAGLITVFPPQGGPFQVPDSAFKPLARVALARLGVPAAVDRADALAGSQSGAPTIVNDPVGGFALWGRPGRSGGSGPVGPGET